VFAGTTAGVFRSDDGGALWEAAGQNVGEFTVNAIAHHHTDPDVVYAGTEHHGIYMSADGGETWGQWGLNDLSIYSILTDSNGAVWVGTEDGVFTRF
jgi:ligand-binding sensor domain-containing protein